GGAVRFGGTTGCGCRSPACRGTKFVLTQPVFETAPLPAELRLMRRTTRDRFRVVSHQCQRARLQTLRQAAQLGEPLLDQLAEFGKRGVNIVHSNAAFRSRFCRSSRDGQAGSSQSKIVAK